MTNYAGKFRARNICLCCYFFKIYNPKEAGCGRRAEKEECIPQEATFDTNLRNIGEMNIFQGTLLRGRRGYDLHWILPFISFPANFFHFKKTLPPIDSLSVNDFVGEVYFLETLDGFFPPSDSRYLLNSDLREKSMYFILKVNVIG